ncbi:hypothetical protein [Geminicoccus roseus]|uniref:hypothetical protein n=1 Tax=Geminicoccus roseus TaxID=404900 RepID=UPI00040790E2|nr:hypothetical protein [Geminicoccus roseus]
MATSASDIDRKLCLTAAAIGAMTRKDLASAFRSVNPTTSFDIERAHKWLQGRARPRERSIYEDWRQVAGLEQAGSWIADCSLEAFLDALCQRHRQDRAILLRRAEAFRGQPARPPADGMADLLGAYVCYSHAWSPYFSGRLVRGFLSIATERDQLLARYVEDLPTGTLNVQGSVTDIRHALHLDLRDPNGHAHFMYCLFPPSAPVSVLGGLMCGTTILGPEPCPSVTRILMIRLPVAQARPPEGEAYLPAGGSIARDLARMGVQLDDPEPADRQLAGFLGSRTAMGMDQVPQAAFRSIVELFDRAWITRGDHAG